MTSDHVAATEAIAPHRHGPGASGSIRLGLLAAGLALGAAAYIDATSRGIPPQVGMSVLTGYSWAYLVAGAIAWDARPESRIGPLMTAVGIAGPLLLFTNSGVPGLGLVPLASVPLMNLFLIWLVLSYPSGQLRSRLDVATVAAVSVTVATVNSLFRVIGLAALDYGAWVMLVVSLTLLLVVILHGLRASAAAREDLAPMFVAGVLVALLFGGESLGTIVGINTEFGSPFRWGMLAARVAVPVAVLVGLLRGRIARAGVADLLVDLGVNPGPAELQQAVARALKDPSATLAYWVPEYDAYADVDGRQVDIDQRSGRASTPIVRDEVPVALILHDEALNAEPRLLESVAAATGMTIQNAQLQVELRARLEELRGSRVRILEAEQRERRRLERDLHDGAQQRLIAVSMELGTLAGQLAEGDLRTRIDGAREEIAASLGELRALAQGIHPAALTDHGLAVALESVTMRAPVPVQLDVSWVPPMSEQVELAAFYIVCEALANVAKHSQATSAVIEVQGTPQHLIVEVTDDGVGGATTGSGSGLRGLADRVEALGGRLHVSSPPGLGTCVRAEIPCG